MSEIWFIALRQREASSSDDPPDKNVTAGRAGTIVLERVRTVSHAISFGFDLFEHEAPGVTIFGFNKSPSISKCYLNNSAITADKTLSVISALTSILCSPS